MTFLTDREWLCGLFRWLSVILFAGGCGFFILFSVVNALSFLSGISQMDFDVDVFLNFFTVVLFVPGVAPLCVAFYLMIFLKRPIYNLVGMLTAPVSVFAHYILMAFAAHSSPMVAFLVGCFELLFFGGVLYLFHRFFVKDEIA